MICFDNMYNDGNNNKNFFITEKYVPITNLSFV